MKSPAKNPHAVALAKARSAALSPERRSEIAAQRVGSAGERGPKR